MSADAVRFGGIQDVLWCLGIRIKEANAFHGGMENRRLRASELRCRAYTTVAQQISVLSVSVFDPLLKDRQYVFWLTSAIRHDRRSARGDLTNA
jgi:hypothetical protein